LLRYARNDNGSNQVSWRRFVIGADWTKKQKVKQIEWHGLQPSGVKMNINNESYAASSTKSNPRQQ
jgi:hypothetical protein